MNWIPDSFRRRKLFADLSEEMRLHLEERVEHLIGEGLSPIEAQRQLFKRVYLELDARIKIFSSLPLDKLDKLSLQERLNEIGKTRLAERFPSLAKARDRA